MNLPTLLFSNFSQMDLQLMTRLSLMRYSPITTEQISKGLLPSASKEIRKQMAFNGHPLGLYIAHLIEEKHECAGILSGPGKPVYFYQDVQCHRHRLEWLASCLLQVISAVSGTARAATDTIGLA